MESNGAMDRGPARSSPRGLVSGTAKIFADQKGAPVIECRVIDLSRGGACLEMMRDSELPQKFVFLHGGVKKRARLIWRKGYRFGVGF